MKKKHWFEYLWIWSIIYFTLGFFNIVFAWLGMIDFLVPLGFAIFGGNKSFCNIYCGRGQLFRKIGKNLKCSRKKQAPGWISSKWFRYGFLVFFLTMFGNMVYQTYLVAAGAANLREVVKLLWTFKIPWGWAYSSGMTLDWIAQFSFGFYSLMLTSTIIGLVVMLLYKPRTWCSFCPMGTMEATCGALIGANMMLGMKTEGKGTVMKSKELFHQFSNMCGASICKDLKGRDTGIVKCECDDCVRNAVYVYKDTI